VRASSGHPCTRYAYHYCAQNALIMTVVRHDHKMHIPRPCTNCAYHDRAQDAHTVIVAATALVLGVTVCARADIERELTNEEKFIEKEIEDARKALDRMQRRQSKAPTPRPALAAVSGKPAIPHSLPCQQAE
jgi:hypothetical protein